MSKIKLYTEMNEKIADLLLRCTNSGMMLYAGTYIKDLERQLAEYREAEEQGHIVWLPVNEEMAVYSIEYCCGLNEENKRGLCHRGFCRECQDGKLYILETTAKVSCKIAELGRSVFFNRKFAIDKLIEKGE